MPTIPLRVSKPSSSSTSTPTNPLPSILHTPSGLALLELQGTIHFPAPNPSTSAHPSTLVGKLVFPLYNPTLNDPSDTKWMKRVYFYVGENQRLQGEVRRLVRPFAVIRRVDGEREEGDVVMGDGDGEGVREELEIVEVVRFKIAFSTRPEPVSAGEG